MTDPIADMLTRLRNAAARAQTGIHRALFPASRARSPEFLEKEGYIAGFELETPEKGHPNLKIKNKFVNKTCAIAGLKRVSKPGLRRYVGAGEVPRVLGGMGIAVLSTSQGVLTGHDARKQNVGGRAPRLHLVRNTSMSRIGKKPIEVPAKVKVNVGAGGGGYVEGPQRQAFLESSESGSGSRGGQHCFPGSGRREPPGQGSSRPFPRARSPIWSPASNEGFKKELEIQGVGFKAAVQGQKLNLSLGKSHPILFQIPTSVKVTVAESTKITIEGVDKHLVGQTAADIRAFHPPEPYKGKGIRYAGEQVRRKEGKTVQ